MTGGGATAADAIGDVSVGVGGLYKVGNWTTLRAKFDASVNGVSPGVPLQLVIEAPDPAGAVVAYPSPPIAAKAGAQQVSGAFRIGRLDGSLHVRLNANGKQVAAKTLRVRNEPLADLPAPVPPGEVLLARLAGENDTGDDQLLERLRESLASGDRRGDKRSESDAIVHLRAVKVPSATELDADTLSSFDVLFISGPRTLDPAQSKAIESWVSAGGHLLLAIGPGAKSFVDGAFGSWLPIKVDAEVQARDLGALESFCRQSTRIVQPGGAALTSARLSTPGGKTLAVTLQGPILCRAAWGFGRVTFLGVDVDADPLVRWDAIGELLNRLIDAPDARTQAEGAGRRLTQSGVSDLSTQLSTAADQFDGVHRATTWEVMALVLGLLVVIGPLDYLLVHKLLKRPQRTWITFPLFVAAASAAAIAWGARGRSETASLRQIDVVDVDVSTNSKRVKSIAQLYSPQSRRYDVSADMGIRAAYKGQFAPLQVGWHGRPENSFGGMNRTAGADLSRAHYDESANRQKLEGLPIAVSSTRAIEAAGWGNHEGLVDAKLESPRANQLVGTIKHSFPEPIEDWILAYEHQVLRPAEDPKTGKAVPLAPGVSWSTRSASQRELGGFLTGTTQKYVATAQNRGAAEELKIEQIAYEPHSRDTDRIVRILTFHAAAGGASYTGMANGPLRAADFTPLLTLNRAVLVGRIKARGAIWKANGPIEPQQADTFVRLVIPVRSTRDERQSP